MSGVPAWPSDLKLSLNTGNWLEWSRWLTSSLSMGQLDGYPLGRITCPNVTADRTGFQNWIGNDNMVLGFMRTQMFTSEVQHIAHCSTSEDAFLLLRTRHEKRSGLTQMQLIQKIMVAGYKFDASSANFDVQMSSMRDLIYRADQIGHLDLAKIAVLFAMFCIRSSFPTVHEALSPALMDGTLTLEAFESRMHCFYEMGPTNQLP